MKTAKPEKAIAQVFEEFLAEQKTRISHKTYLKYQSTLTFETIYRFGAAASVQGRELRGIPH